MKIGVVGVNDIGLSFALICEKNGYDVIISDDNEDYIFNLNQKICNTNEQNIQIMLLNSNSLSATTNTLEVIKESDIIFIFTPTPQTLEGNYDTTKIFDVVSKFYTANTLDIPLYDKKLIVCSTTNPGDVEQVQQRLNMFNVQVSYNPEFTNQGSVVKDFEQSDIILIGTEHIELSNELIQIYKKIQTSEVNAYVMSSKSAELTKLAINSFLTTKITYSNMIGEVMINSGLENEIGMVLSAIGTSDKKTMSYGYGFGGPTIPRDNRSLNHYINNLGLEINLPLIIEDYNKKHSEFLKTYYMIKNPDIKIPFVMDYITYKKGTNGLVESQSFQLCVDLLTEGYMVNVIESDEVSKRLSSLNEIYGDRLKFFKVGTKPEGYKINL